MQCLHPHEFVTLQQGILEIRKLGLRTSLYVEETALSVPMLLWTPYYTYSTTGPKTLV